MSVEAEPFQPDWLNQLSAVEVLQVALSLLLHNHVPDWPGATDEQLEQVAEGLVERLASHGYALAQFDPRTIDRNPF